MQYSQYLFNYIVVNPAYAGYKEAVNLQAFARVQWAGINGAPNIYSLVVDGSTGSNNAIGWGGQIVNETRGATNILSLFSTYAFRLRLNERNDRLAFGLSAGVSQWQVDQAKLIPDPDVPPTVFDGLRPEWRPDFRFGIYYSNPFMYAGVSVTNLFANFSMAAKRPHMYVSAGALIPINNNIALKPTFIYREDFRGPSNIDINLLALLLKELWVGVSYRTGLYLGSKVNVSDIESSQSTNAVAFMMQLFLIKNLQIGYSYDLSLSGWPGTHEISLSYTIPKKKTRLSTPRYF
jgi:type IX secretion system PorP/SprF family membrane protein